MGLNFRDHAAETDAKIPKEPVIFFQSTTALVGPNDDLMIPKSAAKVDRKIEFAIVIGRRALYVAKESALDHVAEYCLHSDDSERTFEMERGRQWVKGNRCDRLARLGPFVTTKDELRDPGNLKMWFKVNGEIPQDGSTTNMTFDAPVLRSYASEFMTLLPGDGISTHTPPGVGLGMQAPQYLKAGMWSKLGSRVFGESRQHVMDYSELNH